MQDYLILQRLLWKLFHIEEKIEDDTRAVNTQNRELVGLREDQKEHDEQLTSAREQQAKARSEVSKRERRIKKQEKVLEAMVCALLTGIEIEFGAYTMLPCPATEHGPTRSADCALTTQAQGRE